MVKTLPSSQNTFPSVFNRFSEHIEKSSSQSHLSRRAKQLKTNPTKNSVKPYNALSRVMYLGAAIAVGGLAIYFYNQSSAIDLNKFLSLGDIYR